MTTTLNGSLVVGHPDSGRGQTNDSTRESVVGKDSVNFYEIPRNSGTVLQ